MYHHQHSKQLPSHLPAEHFSRGYHYPSLIAFACVRVADDAVNALTGQRIALLTWVANNLGTKYPILNAFARGREAKLSVVAGESTAIAKTTRASCVGGTRQGARCSFLLIVNSAFARELITCPTVLASGNIDIA
jgi:hypothetical protein